MNSTARLGVQLYTLRDLMAEDVGATLELVAAIGFREVEFAGYFGHAPVQMRGLLDAAGLSAPAAHIGIQNFREGAAEQIEHAVAMGHQYVVVPWLAEDERTLDDYRRHSDEFNRWGEQCAAAGIQFAYHNHDFEFEETDGKIPYDLLLAETDPELVKMELDLAWTHAGNADAVGYFEKWPGRFPMVHLKDFEPGTGETDIGTGGVEFDRILAEAALAGLRHGFVERDHPEDAETAIRKNFDAIMPTWSRHLRRATAT